MSSNDAPSYNVLSGYTDSLASDDSLLMDGNRGAMTTRAEGEAEDDLLGDDDQLSPEDAWRDAMAGRVKRLSGQRRPKRGKLISKNKSRSRSSDKFSKSRSTARSRSNVELRCSQTQSA